MPIGSKGEGAGGGGATTYDALTDTPVSKAGEKGAIQIVNEAEDALVSQSVPLSAGMLVRPTVSVSGTDLTISDNGVAHLYNGAGEDATISRHPPVPGKVIDLSTLSDGESAQVVVRDSGGVEYFLESTAITTEIEEALTLIVSNIGGTFDVNRFSNARAALNAVANRIQQTERIKRLEGAIGGLIVSTPSMSRIDISSGALYDSLDLVNLAAVETVNDSSVEYDGVGGSVSTVGWNNTQFVDSGGNLVTLTNNRYAINWVFRNVSDETNTPRISVLLGGGDHNLTQALEEDRPTYSVEAIDKTAELVGKIIILKGGLVVTRIDQITEGGGGGFTVSDHNSTTGKQGGTTDEFFHLTDAQHDDLVGGALGSLTDGSILFKNSNGVDQNNSEFFWEPTLRRLGLGTNTPLGRVHAFGNNPPFYLGKHDGTEGSSRIELYFAGSGTQKAVINFWGGSSVIATLKTRVGGSAALIVEMAGTEVWEWTSAGHFEPVADLTFNIGSASNRVAEAFIGTVRLGPLNLDLQALLDSKDSFLDSFDANDVTFQSNPAAASSRNGHPVIAFDDTVDENVIRSAVLPSDYSGGDVNVNIEWVANSTSGNVVWGVEIERIQAGVTDIDSDSFAAQQTVTTAAPGTSGIPVISTIILTQAQADNWTAGDSYRIRVERVATNGSDTMTGDAQVLRVSLDQ